jgi:hypothetical protein
MRHRLKLLCLSDQGKLGIFRPFRISHAKATDHQADPKALRELVEAMEAVLAEAEVKRSTMMPEEAEEVLVVWDSRQESQTLASRQRRLFDVRPQ